MAAAAAVTLPGSIISRAHTDLSYPLLALIFGLAIVGAAFLLSWAAEVAQLDISAGLAIAVLAFIAVLPEYAVDLVFALSGGEAYKEFGPVCQSAADVAAERESDCALALANMTGANRLLIGLGWTMVVFIAWRRYKARGQRMESVQLERTHAVELSFLSVATVYSLTLPLKSSITLIDSAVLVSIFVLYMIRISKAPAEEPHLVGPAEALGQLPTDPAAGGGRRAVPLRRGDHPALRRGVRPRARWRRATRSGSASSSWCSGWRRWPRRRRSCSWPGSTPTGSTPTPGSAPWCLPRSTSGRCWSAPCPSPSPSPRARTDGLPIIARQREEVFLTAAQSLFAVVTLINLSMSLREAAALFTLFWAQFIAGAVVPEEHHDTELVLFGVIYLVLALWGLVGSRREVPRLLQDGFRAKYSELSPPTHHSNPLIGLRPLSR